ncbi:MAG: hypothetical protein JWQ07_4101 [Ramlibacter sp.]|nr:hypothetical protein [Ramlibacter sp.]
MTREKSPNRSRKNLSASLWFSAFGLAAALHSGFACAADPREAAWKLGRVRSTSDIPALRPIHLCLRRKMGAWSAELNPRDGSGCEHAVYADMFGKAFYVVGNDSFPLDALREARAFDLLDEFKRAEVDSRERERIERYRSAFRDATTLEAIAAFETLYRGNDPDGLISQLAPLKQRVQLETYRQKFASMQTVDEIQAFIDDYIANDLEGRLPQARRMLANALNKAAAESKRAVEARATADKQRALEELERRIASCYRDSAAAQDRLDQENRIGMVSGFVRKDVLRQAGEIIVYCEDQLQRDHAEYRKLGGTRPLNAGRQRRSTER